MVSASIKKWCRNYEFHTPLFFTLNMINVMSKLGKPRKKSKPDLSGIYERQGNTLVKEDGTKLLIAERKHTTARKSSKFLVLKPQGKYISSLYARDGWWKFDYNGKVYRLILSLHDCLITVL
jgi:hypothetical protein